MLTGVSMLSVNGRLGVWVVTRNGAGMLFHWDGKQVDVRSRFVPDGQDRPASIMTRWMMTGCGLLAGPTLSGGQENYLYSTTHDQWFGYQVAWG